ncbi:hypothetical protein ACFLIM_32915 [Nonomuraea sp. M3C6]|uniref:Uncharacterized protein n=1 Tax=Nonomuraea marmarensis TaxID=3351344 RepID=A0ABW7AKW7_9ACTN
MDDVAHGGGAGLEEDRGGVDPGVVQHLAAQPAQLGCCRVGMAEWGVICRCVAG